MCAYIRAKGKSGKNFKISVEDKHKYYNFDEQNLVVFKTDATNVDAESTGGGYAIGVSSNNANLRNFAQFALSSNVVISQGTGEDQRVGNKVFMKFLNFTYSIHFNGANFITNFPQGSINDAYYRFRVMVVKFDNALVITPSFFKDWFRDTFTYYRAVNVSGGARVPYQSVQTKRMRESTLHTGKFKILYDKSFKMGKKKVVKMSSVAIKTNTNLNFNTLNNSPTDESFKNIYAFVIGPGNNFLDMDCISQDKTLNFSTEYVNAFTVNAVLKYEWYDM